MTVQTSASWTAQAHAAWCTWHWKSFSKHGYPMIGVYMGPKALERAAELSLRDPALHRVLYPAGERVHTCR